MICQYYADREIEEGVCQYYTNKEIEEDFPLPRCGDCQNNLQVLDDGLYTCKLVMDKVMSKVNKEKGE